MQQGPRIPTTWVTLSTEWGRRQISVSLLPSVRNASREQISAIFSEGDLSFVFLLKIFDSVDSQYVNIAYVGSRHMAFIT